MKQIFETLLLFLLGYATLWSQNKTVAELEASFMVQETIPELRQTLDSAENFTRIPLTAKYYEHPLGIGEANRSGSDYWWKIPAAGFKVRVYLQASLKTGDSLLIYDTDGHTISKLSNADHIDGYWITPPVQEGIVLRYRQFSAGQPNLNISGYSLSLPNDSRKSVLDFGDSGPCEVNIACPEGDNYRDVEKSVVRINVKVGGFEGWCTGTLINNTTQDFKPYILTAEHCGLLGSSFAGASDLSAWEFYFNYQGNTCSNPTSESQVNFTRIVGSELLARSNDNGGDFGSDFALLQLTNTNAFLALNNPYFAGWNRTGTVVSSGVSIHHPEGDIKKVSTFTSSLVSDKFGSSAPDGTHWRVTWAPTVTNHGVTEVGSSGCSIFSNQGLILGVLTGGAASCANNTAPDYYGKFSYSWDQNGTTANQRLKPWLDPTGQGNFVMSGAYRGDSIIPSPPTGEIELAPNPVRGTSLKIWNMGSDEIADFYVFDIAGNLVLKEERVPGLPGNLGQPELDLSKLGNGLYFVRIEQDAKPNRSIKILVSR